MAISAFSLTNVLIFMLCLSVCLVLLDFQRVETMWEKKQFLFLKLLTWMHTMQTFL